MMTPRLPDWQPKDGLAVGKGATVQTFVATVGDDNLEIDVAPWGEGHLKVNGREVALSTMPRIGARRFASCRSSPKSMSRGQRSDRRARGSQP